MIQDGKVGIVQNQELLIVIIMGIIVVGVVYAMMVGMDWNVKPKIEQKHAKGARYPVIMVGISVIVSGVLKT